MDTPASSRAALMRYRDPKGAIEWLQAAFQFKTRLVSTRADGSFAYAHLALGDQQITVTARDERSLEPAERSARDSREHTLAVPDIAAHYAHAKAADAEIVRDLAAGTYACRDLEGNLWSFHAAKAPLLAWARARLPRVEKRVGIAVAAVLTLLVIAISLRPLIGEPATEPALAISEGQALESARFALAEEMAARRAAEAARSEALAELAKERTARLTAQHDAEQLETELAAAHAERDSAASRVEDLNQQITAWETEVARAADKASPPAQTMAEVVAVSAATKPPPQPKPAAAASIIPVGSPELAGGRAALAKGDIAEARRAFRGLAEAGLPEAALALGSTYDPVNVGRNGLAADDVDAAQAKHWYRRAIELKRAESVTERQGEQ